MNRPRGRPPHDDVLTPAEWRTVHWVRHGLTNREIAKLSGISLDAVKYHVANAVAKLGVRNRKALRHWQGAPKESAMHTDHSSFEHHNRVSGIGQIARSVKDITKSENWYKNVLQLDHLYTFDKLAFFDCGGTRLMLNQVDELNMDESVLYLRVDDIKGSHAEMIERGVEFISAPHMIHKHDDGTEEWMAFFKDPEGRTLAILSAVSAS